MRVLVCGGRDYRDRRRVFDTLDAVQFVEPITELIHGAARGADTLADEWAKARGVKRTPVPAKWYPQPGQLDRGAGPKRNRQMLTLQPDLVVAFPGGTGTADMADISEAAGVLVLKIESVSQQVKA